MAETEAGGRLQKSLGGGGVGKSTLVTNPRLSVPMPLGATPPPVPPAQGAGQTGQGGGISSGRGSATHG